MRIITSAIFFIVGVVGALVIAIYWGIISPFINIAEMIDTNTLTATAVVYEGLKFVFREILAFMWVVAFLGLAGVSVFKK